jgi:DNA-binding protein HU-beta
VAGGGRCGDVWAGLDGRGVSGESLRRRINNAYGGNVVIVNKDELGRAVAARSGLDIGQAKAAIDAALEEIAEQIGAGNEVRLTGFGKFSAVQRGAREGRNPRTGESMQIAAKSVPKFSAGAELKKAVL